MPNEDSEKKRGNIVRLKGGIRKFDSNSKIDAQKGTTKWIRGNDHLEHYTSLISIELEDELKQVEERWKKWSKSKLKDAGVALFGLEGRKNGTLFGERILSFKSSTGPNLPWHKFGHGDIVIISRKRPWDEKVYEGVVLDRNNRRIRVVVSDAPSGLRQGTWRLDRGANKVAHDRMKNSLLSLHSTEGKGGTLLRDLLMASVHDVENAASIIPELGPLKKKMKHINLTNLKLNDSQEDAVNAAIQRKITLIQGPPGTGKTHTAVELLTWWVKQRVGPILATADSNVAVDNLLGGLLDRGIKAVRIGQPVKVREELRNSTLAAKMDEHPLADEIKAIISENKSIQRKMSSAKGKEKGLAHRDISRNWKDVRMLEQKMMDEIIRDADIVCATCIGSGHRVLDSYNFPIVLIDEATQAIEPSTLVPIVKGCRQLVMLGDHHQLPPTVISQRAEEKGLVRSMFQRLIDAGIKPFMLRTQYRMHPIISEFPSARFYENKLKNGVTSKDRLAPAGFLWPDWDKPVAFVPIEGKEMTDAEGASKSNKDEAAALVEVVKSLLEGGELSTIDIGIITPYNGQVRLISDIFEQIGGRDDDGKYKGLEIKSVDGYQGREKEVIVFSTVRANDNQEIGFLSDWRRLNVAITRAKRGLIIMGNISTLRNDKNWSAWMDWIDEGGMMAWHMSNL